MAFSTQTVVSDGSLALLDISIEYLDRSEITVYFNSVPTALWAWVGTTDKQITFTPAVPVGVVVLVKRTTVLSVIRHEFSLGAAFTAQSLDEGLKQVLHIAQEATEANFSGDFYGAINMHINRITNVANAVDPQDVPSFSQLTTVPAAYLAATQVSAAEAAASAAAALISENNAASYVAIINPTNFQPRDPQLDELATGVVPAAFQPHDTTLDALALGTITEEFTSTATSAIQVPQGSIAQRPTGANGKLRYNSELLVFEGFSAGAWGSIGGGAKGAGSNAVFVENDTNVTGDYTITNGKNAMSAGPITIDTGVTVTVPTGSVWTIV